MRVSFPSALLVACACVAAASASAATTSMAPPAFASTAGCTTDIARDPWAVHFDGVPDRPVAIALPDVLPDLAVADQDAPRRRPVAFEYSEAYKVRARIHKVASFLTLPLFAADYVVGQDLYNNRGDSSKRSLHVGLVTGTAVLFGINTITGAWNLWEGRKDPNHRAKRMTHGILMLLADAGFMATAAMAPGGDHRFGNGTTVRAPESASSHRAMAISSMGIATVSYLIMLIGGH